jgi:hypothetical protein
MRRNRQSWIGIIDDSKMDAVPRLVTQSKGVRSHGTSINQHATKKIRPVEIPGLDSRLKDSNMRFLTGTPPAW